MSNVQLDIDAIRKMYEHEPCLTPEERARHIEEATDHKLGKPTTVIRERDRVGIFERTDGWKAR